ncbi:aldo/keto reductase [Aldersonia sp. NBC_00410]|uniref:aldo/keto reductase n=1 Tax=Aldersonia sp. NBC_00410 TaxID=2975954 RepID=UPI002257F94F|nr:aldo/keto reductase [Aldersonia sp. NBC_00410]MCX5042790.1 aldo/keto reductase [Aldersonia sp. NBC_00410]
MSAANPSSPTARRPLGDGLTTSALGFGGMALTPVYGGIEPDAALATLTHAVDAGVTFLDTANVYGLGANEKLIARLLADRRAEVTVATKFGIAGNPATGDRASRGDAAYVAQCADESLSRLGIDVIDLYYLHRIDPAVPIEETVSAMSELVRAGKVRHLGLSEVTADELRRANAVHPIAAVQSEWSLFSRDVERHVVPAAAELGVGFVPYAPLGRGFLTGTVSAASIGSGDIRGHFPRFADDALQENLILTETIAALARTSDATPAQLCLAWLIDKGERLGLPVVPIPGTRRPERIDENLGALSVHLDETVVTALDAIAAQVSGARSADASWVSAGRE